MVTLGGLETIRHTEGVLGLTDAPQVKDTLFNGEVRATDRRNQVSGGADLCQPH